MKEEIQNYMESNLKGFELCGVELTEEDYDFAEEKISKGMTLEKACDEVLQGIRDCLDEGLESLDEE